MPKDLFEDLFNHIDGEKNKNDNPPEKEGEVFEKYMMEQINLLNKKLDVLLRDRGPRHSWRGEFQSKRNKII